MTVKSVAGVLALSEVFKVAGKNLISIPEEKLGLTKKQIGRCLSYALLNVRQLHIRLNEWDRIEIDLVEDHPNHKLIDVNFLKDEIPTHRVLGIKIHSGNPIQFQSVAVSSK